MTDTPSLLDCVHCGLCLQECPTYRVGRVETESPRGRLFLMRAVDEGRLEFAAASGPLGRCLQCRACEPVCPSKVGYAALLGRHQEGRGSRAARWLQRRLLNSRRALAVTGWLLRTARRGGLLRLFERRRGPRRDGGLDSSLGERLSAMAGAVPGAPERFAPAAGSVFPARGERRGRVALHHGCANVELLGQVPRDTIALFQAQGYEVLVPAQPACCGALHAHAGDAGFGHALAQRTARAFADAHDGAALDAVVVPAAGCLAHLLEAEPEAQPAFAEPLLFLHRAGLRTRPTRLAARVSYDPPCHLRNVVGAGAEVEELLAAIPGLELAPHEEAELCCGAGGVAFAREPRASFAVTERKLERVREQRPSHLASGNPGCMLRLEAEVRRTGGGVEVVHPVSLLARACGAELRPSGSPSGTSSRPSPPTAP